MFLFSAIELSLGV